MPRQCRQLKQRYDDDDDDDYMQLAFQMVAGDEMITPLQQKRRWKDDDHDDDNDEDNKDLKIMHAGDTWSENYWPNYFVIIWRVQTLGNY